MTLHLAYDASRPPTEPYPGAEGVMGYVGGNTPHVWTLDEWLVVQHLRQWPIWVGYLEDDPATHAQAAVTAVRGLGWTPGGSDRRAILLDFETETDPAWVDAFAIDVYAGGYETMVYGSAAFIEGNPVRSGRWIALYNGQQNIPAIPGAVGHQYQADVPFGHDAQGQPTAVDLSVVTDEMIAHSGYGPRH